MTSTTPTKRMTEAEWNALSPEEQAFNSDLAPKITMDLFGEVQHASISAYTLIKGQPKRPFVQGVDPESLRRWFFRLEITCLKHDGTSFMVTQDVADFDKKWAVTAASLRALGVTFSSFSSLRDKWVRVKKVPTGGKYTSKGTEYEESGLSFVTIYPGRDECMAEYEAERALRFPKRSDENTDSTTGAEWEGGAGNHKDLTFPVNAPTAVPVDTSATLRAIWTAVGGQRDAFLSIKTSNDSLSNISDDEALRIVGA